ncbi:hypothetical protein [Polaromonas sp. A23]|uniref:hypothetical protein n=1 Tax=Polaromonas sp. A23 TaxID=1944133 RepID=UPI0009848ACB|nr:hypothetical protein [Polaromonas sp. A23]OOG43949.1 hypothetical protein B0B52_08560 [Polaromonas sp. A23]
MKKQIERFSPHQNAKVFAVLMAVSSLVFVIPFMLIAAPFAHQGAGMSALAILAFPVIYLVMGYLSVAIGCWVYNLLFPYIGGIEFQSRDTHD